ncbi:MAG: hypothetical protein OSJ36_04050 [Odoribacter sp.]|nr:hypothetical protein [Odoribacter sp.]MDE6878254.1 hypothetical protein [Odoribacter sp.]
MEAYKDLEDLLKEIKCCCDQGDRKKLPGILRELMQFRQQYYQDSILRGRQDDFSESLFKILLLELDEEESDSIETAELAYTGLTSVMNDPEAITPAHYKRRLLLLHYFSDYFTDAIIEIFLKKYRDDNLLEARNMALECIEKMQLSDMLLLEEHHPDFINGDEQLADACNAISLPPELSEAERTEAALLHKVLHAYLKAKYKN